MSEGRSNPLLKRRPFDAVSPEEHERTAELRKAKGLEINLPDPCPYVSLKGPGGEPGIEIGVKGTF